MWLFLITIKVCNGLVMLGQACAHVHHYRQLQVRGGADPHVTPTFKPRPLSVLVDYPSISLVDYPYIS